MATAKNRRRDQRDDLTELRHIGDKSERALNDGGIYTRRELLAADREHVMAVLQSTQRLSEQALDDLLDHAAELEESGSESMPSRSHLPEQPSVHVFEVQVTARAHQVIATSVRHVVGGAPSVWEGFDPGRLTEFINAAVGLELTDATVASEPAPAKPLSSPEEGRSAPDALGLVHGRSELSAPSGAEDLVVVLRMAGDPPDSLDRSGTAAVTVLGRDWAHGTPARLVGRASVPTAQLLLGSVRIPCPIQAAGTFGIDALVELPRVASGGGTPETDEVSWLALELESSQGSVVPAPPRLDLMRSRFEGARRAG